MSSPLITDGRVGPVAALWARWWLGLILLIIGGVVGALVSDGHPVQYTAESRLVVGSENLSSYQVAGFALASQQLASNYARYVDNSSIVTSDLRQSLGSRADQLISVSASPIAQSDVVSVEAVAASRSAARAAARSVANTLVRLTGSSQSTVQSKLLRTYEGLAGQAQTAADDVTTVMQSIAKARQAKNDTDALEKQLITAQTRTATLRLQAAAAGSRYQTSIVNPPSDSQLNIIIPAAIIADNSRKQLEIYTIGGGIAGLLVALVLANLLERRRRRRSSRSRRHALEPGSSP